MEPFDKDLLLKGAEALGVALDAERLRLFEVFCEMLCEWNSKINLTSLKSREDIIIKHFIDSLTVFPIIQKCLETGPEGRSGDIVPIIDVGSGAGFPSIPLKLAAGGFGLPWRFTAVDSTGKKVNFIKEASSALGFAGSEFEPVHSRAEDLAADRSYREKYRIAIARAVAPLPVLIEYCLPFVSLEGFFIAMKGTRETARQEVDGSKKALSELGGEIHDVTDLILPFTDNARTVVTIRKFRHTSNIYPRKSGLPSKKPLK